MNLFFLSLSGDLVKILVILLFLNVGDFEVEFFDLLLFFILLSFDETDVLLVH